MKKYLFNLLLASKKKGDSAWYFNMFIIVLILLNIISIELESVESIRLWFDPLFFGQNSKKGLGHFYCHSG